MSESYKGYKPASEAGLPKLVREKMPEIILKDGFWVKYRKATPAEIPALLKAKLKEEFKELLATWDDPERWPDVKELADLMAVVRAISNHLDGFTRTYDNKCDECGGMNSDIVLLDYGLPGEESHVAPLQSP